MTIRKQVEEENFKKLNRRLWVGYSIVGVIAILTGDYKWILGIPVIVIVGFIIHSIKNPSRVSHNPGDYYTPKSNKKKESDHFIYTQMFLNNKK